LLTAVAIGGCFYLAGKHIEYNDRSESAITVTGEGKVKASPDIASLSFGVSVQRAATSKAAMDQLTKQMTAVIDAVKKAGVTEKDFSTEQLALNPAYDWTNGNQVLRGYDASQMLRVKVRDLAKTSSILGAATAAGANQAYDVQFTIDEPEALRAQARQQAILDARRKAELLADQLDVDLGELKGYGEDTNGYTPPMMYARGGATADSAMAPEPAGTPLPAGEQEVRVNVSLTYEIED
jgi:uncharacterized protein YggE